MQFDFFGGSVPSAIARPVAVPKRTAPKDAKADYAQLLQDRDWLASQWEALHLWLLKRHLRLLLCPHTAAEERTDILVWIQAPLQDGSPPALSFQACVAVYDPRIMVDDFRRTVLQYYRRHLTGRRVAR